MSLRDRRAMEIATIVSACENAGPPVSDEEAERAWKMYSESVCETWVSVECMSEEAIVRHITPYIMCHED